MTLGTNPIKKFYITSSFVIHAILLLNTIYPTELKRFSLQKE
jgi:hypothetical protein